MNRNEFLQKFEIDFKSKPFNHFLNFFENHEINNLSENDFIYFIENIDLTQPSTPQDNLLFNIITHYRSYNKKILFTENIWKSLVKQSNFEKTNVSIKASILTASFNLNKTNEINFSKEILDLLINQLTTEDLPLIPIITAFKYNKFQNLNLTNENFKTLINNTQLNKINADGWTAFAIFCENYYSQDLTAINTEQISKLMKNVPDYHEDMFGWTSLDVALTSNLKKTFLNKEQFNYLLDHHNITQITTVKNFISFITEQPYIFTSKQIIKFFKKSINDENNHLKNDKETFEMASDYLATYESYLKIDNETNNHLNNKMKTIGNKI
jgi:hypothetical protein